MDSRKAIQGAAWLAVGQGAGYALSFVRNLVLARVLTKADYGLASALALAVTILEIVGRIGLGQMVIRIEAKSLNPCLQSAHAFQIVCGLAGGVLLALCAPLFAAGFRAPEHAWAFAVLAVIPVCAGLEHLDIYRYQRESRFLPGAISEVVPQLIATVAVWPLAAMFGDFRAVLWLMVGKAACSVMITHAVAELPFRPQWNREMVKEMLWFGGPLLLNGLILFASHQADQMVIGMNYSMEDLAAYTVVASILAVPWVFFAKVFGPVFLSGIAPLQRFPKPFALFYQRGLELAAFVTAIAIVPLMVAGGQMTGWVFGREYSGLGGLMAILAGASAIRYLRSVPAIAAMAVGDTKNQMLSNAARVTGLPFALVMGVLGARLETIAACAIVGELTALAASLHMMKKTRGISARAAWKPIVFLIGSVAGAGMLQVGGCATWPFGEAAAGALGVLAIAVLAGWFLFPELRAQLFRRPTSQAGVASSC